MASVMKSLLSWTTTVEPLSALLMINVGLLINSLRVFLSCLVRLSVFSVCVCVHSRFLI